MRTEMIPFDNGNRNKGSFFYIIEVKELRVWIQTDRGPPMDVWFVSTRPSTPAETAFLLDMKMSRQILFDRLAAVR